MDVTLDAGCVTVTDEYGVLLLGFADEEFDTSTYVLLQRPHEYDAQDVALGMDRVHIERDDQSLSSYGGIEAFRLTRDRAFITLDDDAATKLEAGRIEIRFALDDARFDLLRSGLRRLFEGTTCLAEGDA